MDNFVDLLGAEPEDDLLGGDIYIPPKKRQARVNKHPKLDESTFTDADASDVASGVSVPWLATVFRISRPKLQDIIHGLRPIRINNRGVKFYDIADAAAYIVKPKMSVDDFIRTIKKNDMPEQLKESFWNSKLKEQKFRRLAGDLWTKESILTVIGELLQTIKNTTLLWADTVEEECGVTDDQRQLLLDLREQLLLDIVNKVKDQMSQTKTASQLSELESDYSDEA